MGCPGVNVETIQSPPDLTELDKVSEQPSQATLHQGNNPLQVREQTDPHIHWESISCAALSINSLLTDFSFLSVWDPQGQTLLVCHTSDIIPPRLQRPAGSTA